MKRLGSALATGLLGALVGGVFSALAFFLAATLDGARVGEAAGFGLAVGVGGAFFGALVGFVVGLGNLGLVGGGITGLLATAAAVAFYVVVFGRPTSYGYFLRESGVLVAVLILPMILTGVATAFLKNRFAGR